MPFVRSRKTVGHVGADVGFERCPTAPANFLLGLQQSAGNHAVSRLVARQPVAVQRGVLSALGRGYDMYTRMTDEGAPFAQELMRWRIIGLGSAFVKRSSQSDWNDFMCARPEIQTALAAHLATLVPGFVSGGPTGSFYMGGYRGIVSQLTGVRLNQLESMRLTLHGCHRIEVGGRYWVGDVGGVQTIRIFPRLVWVDRGDLHPGIGTKLSGGQVVDDREFTAAGFDYDIWIEFDPGESRWEMRAGTATHTGGWPPITGVPPVGGFRG